MKQQIIIDMDMITGKITVDWGDATLPEVLGYLELAKIVAQDEFRLDPAEAN